MERLLTLYSEVQSTDVRWLWYHDDESDCGTFNRR